MAQASSSQSPQHLHPQLTDSLLQPFLTPTFDPITYLNATLPPLVFSSSISLNQSPRKPTATTTVNSNAASLSDLSTKTQTLLSHLNAHSTRLSTTLTTLTDDILRSGSRLAYEVELLRSETSTLTDLLSSGLKDDIEQFLPPISTNPPMTKDQPASSSAEPDHLTSLRTYTTVKTRLEHVIRTLGSALQWTLPPSELASASSSFISVSGPSSTSSDPSSDSPDSLRNREEKGQLFAAELRAEIADAVVGGGGVGAGDGDGEADGAAADARKGYEDAMARIQALRELAGVWKGTGEERARARAVEALVKVAEEGVRSLHKESLSAARAKAGLGPGNAAMKEQERQRRRATIAGKGGVGFMEGLRRLGDETA